ADFHLAQALRSRPDDAAVLRRRGRALAEQGLWQDARDDFARAAAKAPDDAEAWRGPAPPPPAPGPRGPPPPARRALLPPRRRPASAPRAGMAGGPSPGSDWWRPPSPR